MSDKKTKPRGLGRGLSALMADVAPVAETTSEDSRRTADIVVPIEKLVPNPDQPRRDFRPEDLDDLAASIREKGVLQPLIVRPASDGAFEIVAGERRWRASQQAQLHEIPVLVREYSDTEVLEVAIIENIQRANLNAVEEAAGYRQLMDRFGHTQEKLSEALGKSRSHIANLLRLLSLPDDVQSYLRDGKLSAGHARALIMVDNPSEVAKAVIQKGLSVRATEAMVKKQKAGPPEGATRRASRKVSEKDADTRALEGDLSSGLGMKVSIDHKPNSESGKVLISYETLEQLDELCSLLTR
ncbi:ParB/RepB/Spo0J family partition protein [Primorskyibacter sp. S87]|uniref:ParB/RepB/Spo0J family partition protein n=1 Tax=Primorskyibacter sp. S87 TaxID=3415126 RepID=UPI003C7ED419